MKQFLLVVSAAAVVASSGASHGIWSGRWDSYPEVSEYVDRLDRIPIDVGDWRGSDLEMDAAQMSRVRIAGYKARSYENRRTGQRLQILLVCGPAGPIAVHTPDVCYQGAGFRLSAGPESVVVSLPEGGQDAPLMAARFSKEDAGPGSDLRVLWCWNARGNWETPKNPRWTFARDRALYKLYVIQQLRPSNSTLPGNDYTVAFLKEFLPELQKSLFGPV